MNTHSSVRSNRYSILFIMIGLSFVSMYAFMYVMVDVFSNIYFSFNQLYMAVLMTTPMVVIELLLMGSMYHNKKLNILIICMSILVFILSFTLIRQQVGISDKQFLRSMIPHHAGAILMCKQASLRDVEIKELCKKILVGQQMEIVQMQEKLKAL